MATNEDFYQIIEQIPAGRVTTYGKVAEWAGSPGGAQAVGNALLNRPLGRPIPWQRVVNNDGDRGFLKGKAPVDQRALLEIEGIGFDARGFISLKQFGWGGPDSGQVLEYVADAADAEELDDEPTVGGSEIGVNTEFDGLSDADLLKRFADVMQEIRRRDITRGMNNPVADYAESLAAKALNAKVMPQSNTGYDLCGPDNARYEVKARRLNGSNKSRQLSAIRNLHDRHFDFLVGVLFNEDFTVYRAAIVPWEVVKDRAVYRKHTNAWNFQLKDEVWSLPGVKDLTLG